MKVKAQHNGQEIEVEIDLAAHQLVPASRITEESAKRAAKEKEAADALKELAAIKASSDLAMTRLTLAGEAAPSERDAKRLRAAWQADIEGMDKPLTFAEWSAKDGAAFISALRPAAPAPTPAAAAPAPAGAAPTPAPAPSPAPSTSAGTIPANPGARPTPAQVQAQQAQLLAQRKLAIERGDTKTADALKQQIQGLYGNQSGTGA